MVKQSRDVNLAANTQLTWLESESMVADQPTGDCQSFVQYCYLDHYPEFGLSKEVVPIPMLE